MRWKRQDAGRSGDSPRQATQDWKTGEGAGSGSDRIRADLERRGVAADLSDSLSRRLAAQLASRSSDAYEATLDGVAAAYAVESGTYDDLSTNLKELREVERLMESFVVELGKLDEALEVLAAYVRRMRTQSARHQDPSRTIH